MGSSRTYTSLTVRCTSYTHSSTRPSRVRSRPGAVCTTRKCFCFEALEIGRTVPCKLVSDV